MIRGARRTPSPRAGPAAARGVAGRCGSGLPSPRGAATILAALLAAPAMAQEAPPEPDGYRMGAYRAPVPETLEGATVLTTEEAHALWSEGGAAFVDVLPRPGRPADLPQGTLWRPEARDDIPGSVWLPNTGHGALSAQAEAYFADGLEAATGGDPAVPVVFYCLSECWMSWNAGRRALEMGHEDVRWYPEGTDGWTAAGHPVEPREPRQGAPGA